MALPFRQLMQSTDWKWNLCYFDSWNVLQNNDTPLHKASWNGQTEVCRYLIKAGAGVDRVNSVSINYPVMTS